MESHNFKMVQYGVPFLNYGTAYNVLKIDQYGIGILLTRGGREGKNELCTMVRGFLEVLFMDHFLIMGLHHII